MSKEQESFDRIKLFIDHMNDDFDSEDVSAVDNALNRLEAIDNANPSEALECLEALEQDIKDRVILAEDRQLKLCAVIKQALLKAQEPKKYLTWEDLDFDVPATIKVKMGDTQYLLSLRIGLTDIKSVVLRDNNLKPFLHLYEKEKQFFNDLHLERVEE